MTNQNFSVYAGDTKNIIITTTTEYGTPLNLTGATIKWRVRKKEFSPIIFSKESPNITVFGNEITIPLAPVDTDNLSGSTLYHECKITDQTGNVSTLFTGFLTIK
jgi:hypothetical protein